MRGIETGLRKRMVAAPYYVDYGRRLGLSPGVVPGWGPDRNSLGKGMELKEAWTTALDTSRKENDKKSQPWTCKNNFLEYTTNSSMHGLKYIGLTELSICERCFWGVAFLLAVSAAAFFIWNLFNRFSNMPVIMSLSPSNVDLVTLPFPAITLCNMNNFRRKNANAILAQSSEGIASRDRKLLYDICGKDTVDVDKVYNNKTPWDYMQKFMIANTQPCHEMLVYCAWNGDVKNCTQLFNPTLTDEGMCCTFNRLPRSYIFSNPRDLSDLNVTFEFPSVDWTPEKEYPADASNDSLPWRPVGAGNHMGLTIVADGEIEEYYCSSENSVGFKVLLHNPIETPKVASFGDSIPTGGETRVVIEPKIIQSDRELMSISTSKRQCYFEGERTLKYYKTYTQRNCNLECEANFTLVNCNCVLYYMSKDNDTRICGGSDLKCASRAQRKVEELLKPTEEELLSGLGNQTCHCLPGCWEVAFGMKQSTSALSDNLVPPVDFVGEHNVSYFTKNMAVIHFFYVQKQFTATNRGVLYGFTEFLSNTGGILGLFMGFSFLSAVEIVYYLSLRVLCAIRQQKQSVKDEDSHQITINPYDVSIPFTQ